MINDENTILQDLESKEISTANTIASLASQGYVVNKIKNVKLSITNILIHLFSNINLLTQEQKDNINIVYNKLKTL